MLSASSALEFLAEQSDELCSSIEDFRCQKKCGEIDLNFSQGELASVEIIERFEPSAVYGSLADPQCTAFAAVKVSWFIKNKRSGRVSLMFDSGAMCAVKSYLRLAPRRKNGDGA
jgi:hypothetical protein